MAQKRASLALLRRRAEGFPPQLELVHRILPLEVADLPAQLLHPCHLVWMELAVLRNLHLAVQHPRFPAIQGALGKDGEQGVQGRDETNPLLQQRLPALVTEVLQLLSDGRVKRPRLPFWSSNPPPLL